MTKEYRRGERGRAQASQAGRILLLLASMARWNCTGEAAICDSMKIEHTSGLPTFVSVSPIRGSSKCHMGPAIAHAAAVLSVYSIVIGDLSAISASKRKIKLSLDGGS